MRKIRLPFAVGFTLKSNQVFLIITYEERKRGIRHEYEKK